MEQSLTAMADQLLDEIVPLGAGDFVQLFASPFPALAIGELLVVRGEDREMFGELTAITVAALSGGDVERYLQAKEALGDYIDARLAERESLHDSELRADVLTAMLRARAEGVLSPGEVRQMGHQLLIAGHETTTSLLGMMLLRLIQNPLVMQRLRDDPSLIPAAVEEALRFDSPVNGLFRTNSSE